MPKLERVLMLVGTIVGGSTGDQLGVTACHAEDGYRLFLVRRSTSGGGGGSWPIDFSEYTIVLDDRGYPTINEAIDHVLQALEAALKNKVEVLEREAAAARKAVG